VRDPRPPRTSSPNRGKRGRSDPEDEGDPGVTDKRLLVVEPEFARVLKVSERENSTLSAVIRDAWDGRPMAVMIKRDAPRATGAHISILGHITTHELRRRLTEEAMANGFANRFLYVCTQRVRYLPEGGELHSVDLQPYLKRLKESYDFARFRYQVQRDDAAKELWHDIYRPLSEGHPGLFGQITARAEAQVLRLASIYALLDCSATVGVEHLKAALSVWHYCEQSVRFIFGTATGDPLADQILQTLRDRRDAGMTRNEIRDSFHRNRTAGQIDLALKRLAEIGVVRSTRETTDGRPAERWFAI